jgi:hypothetical protein
LLSSRPLNLTSPPPMHMTMAQEFKNFPAPQ